VTELAGRRDEILDAAEAMIRSAGFNGFSTRDVAEVVGIKAASVHYHFPTKADMGVAVTERYTERFLEGLGDASRFKGNAQQAVKLYVDAFRQALVRDGKLCLCAVLGAEIGSLPTEVGGHTRIFFERNIEWLKTALSASTRISTAKARAHAVHILAAVEGAMILSITLDDNSIFESVGKSLAGLTSD
jgi:TetR/AcrR family transcriptional regulator, transcriptional repressor for nem operon